MIVVVWRWNPTSQNHFQTTSTYRNGAAKRCGWFVECGLQRQPPPGITSENQVHMAVIPVGGIHILKPRTKTTYIMIVVFWWRKWPTQTTDHDPPLNIIQTEWSRGSFDTCNVIQKVPCGSFSGLILLSVLLTTKPFLQKHSRPNASHRDLWDPLHKDPRANFKH